MQQLTSCDQFTGYCSTPLLLILQPSISLVASSDVNAQNLPFKAYEPTIELRDRKSRSVFIEVPYNVETGEAERIAVDWTARGGGSGTSCTHKQPLSQNWLTYEQWSRIFKPSERL
jgi:COP9 signalosome complex subunit 6